MEPSTPLNPSVPMANSAPAPTPAPMASSTPVPPVTSAAPPPSFAPMSPFSPMEVSNSMGAPFNFHMMRIEKPPLYNGEADVSTFENWCYLMSEYLFFYNVPPSYHHRVMGQFLRGRAIEWYRNCIAEAPTPPTDKDMLIADMKRYFLPANAYDTLYEQFYQLRLVEVANIQMRTLKTEVGKGSM
ncbi:hypothetical protein SJAG_06637 [Schizosaccharomyces japonicus yFS275]|uniref:Retrotransposon gag domain-containing protein n=1 Tax=Schizosaccharomyces japonicus (strain yFS275 / FY16936) TaxID=402676 RepID=T0S0W8_SCHJY|nr:hypothetical protein SJAG_06637 [Schizosaccharomyces japonicus yFS275]EQC52962.1 hypothetical protein SJAG_06637 [Schizosaccharomyces japonicus yFS275]